MAPTAWSAPMLSGLKGSYSLSYVIGWHGHVQEDRYLMVKTMLGVVLSITLLTAVMDKLDPCPDLQRLSRTSMTANCLEGHSVISSQAPSYPSDSAPKCRGVSGKTRIADPVGVGAMDLPVLPPSSAPVLSISPNGYYFRLDGQPYFWVGDTAWYLNGYPAGYSTSDATRLLEDRATKGVRVVQSGLITSETTQLPYDGGPDDPFIDSVPMALNESYWAKIDHLVRETARLGMIFTIAPVWGAQNDLIFPDPDRHVEFVMLIAKRYATQAHVVWIGAGEYQKITYEGKTGTSIALSAAEKLRYSRVVDTIRAHAHSDSLITFHPDGGKRTSIDWQSNAKVQFNMHQAFSNIRAVIRDIPLERAASPPKPVVEAEAYYEDVPPATVSTPWHIRMSAYHTAMLGGAGYTYGSDLVWKSDPKWQSRMTTEGSDNVFRSYRTFMRLIHDEGNVPAPTYLVDKGEVARMDLNSYTSALRNADNTRLYAYVSNGRSFKINTSLLAPGAISGQWYDPRQGMFQAKFNVKRRVSVLLDPPGSPMKKNDWALVIGVTPLTTNSAMLTERRRVVRPSLSRAR